MILKGLDTSFTESEVFNELKGLQMKDIEIVKVSYLKSRFKKDENGEGIALPMFLVQFTPQSSLGGLKNYDNLFDLKIRWEKLKKNTVSQCFNCQRLGHTASGCKLPYRCCKCSENHKPKECKVKDKQKTELYCILCKDICHPSSYSKCPKRIEYIEKIKKLNLRKNQPVEFAFDNSEFPSISSNRGKNRSVNNNISNNTNDEINNNNIWRNFHRERNSSVVS
jgi:hypothetical protein